MPKAEVTNLADLTAGQTADLWLCVQSAVRRLTTVYCNTSSTIELKDGLHRQLFVNIIPRVAGDLPENDKIYEYLECPIQQLDNAQLYSEAQRLSSN